VAPKRHLVLLIDDDPGQIALVPREASDVPAEADAAEGRTA
jgi:hypothetical protein